MAQEHELPKARTQGLVVKDVRDEVLVYDLQSQKAHSLNRVAAAVWRACDGKRSVREISTAAGVGPSLPPDVVNYALHTLGRARLLEGPINGSGLTRRQVMARIGAAAIMLPVVTTIVAPTEAQAQSVATCLKENQGVCSSAAQCCPGACGGANCVCVFSKDKFRCVRPTIE